MLTPGDLQYAFFCNSGTEANEGALKLAKLHGKRKKANHTNGIISCLRGFHGKSFGSLSITGKAAWREPFYPLAPNVRFIPYGDADALHNELKVCDTIGLDISAFIAEPVQGEAGAHVPPDDYLPQGARALRRAGRPVHRRRSADRHGTHRHPVGLRALGRGAGHHDHGQGAGRRRDARGLLHRHRRGLRAFEPNPFIHTTTFGGNPVATSAVIGALHATVTEDIPKQAAEKGAWLKERFLELQQKYPDLLEEVRGIGLLIGLEYTSEEAGYAVATGLFGEGVLTGGTLFSAKTFRIEPPATLTQHQMDEIVRRLDLVMGRVDAQRRDGALTRTDGPRAVTAQEGGGLRTAAPVPRQDATGRCHQAPPAFPSTSSAWPERLAPASDATNMMSEATSSAVTMVRSDTASTRSAYTSS